MTDFKGSILGSVFKMLRKPTRLLYCRDFYEMKKVWQTAEGEACAVSLCKTGIPPSSHWLPLLSSDGWQITVFTRRPAEASIPARLDVGASHDRPISFIARLQPISEMPILDVMCHHHFPLGRRPFCCSVLHNLRWHFIRLLVKGG